jgi:membrane-associated phospholipid phosphatase
LGRDSVESGLVRFSRVWWNDCGNDHHTAAIGPWCRMQVALHPHLAGLSFVSGHAIITFAIAGLLALVLPRRWAVVAFVLATLNAVARVYLGAHNPLDVVGGAAVGLAIAAALDLMLDVARDRTGGRPGRAAPTGVDRAI